MPRPQLTAIWALLIVAIFLVGALFIRLQDGRCRPGGWKSGLYCAYPPASSAGGRGLPVNVIGH